MLYCYCDAIQHQSSLLVGFVNVRVSYLCTGNLRDTVVALHIKREWTLELIEAFPNHLFMRVQQTSAEKA